MQRAREMRAEKMKHDANFLELRNNKDLTRLPRHDTDALEPHLKTQERIAMKTVTGTTRPVQYQSDYDMLPRTEQEKFPRPGFPMSPKIASQVVQTSVCKGVPPMVIYEATKPQ